LNSSLRRVHRSVLAGLAVCALVVATTGNTEATSEATNPATYTVAMVLALGSILARRAAPAAAGQRQVILILASLVLALGVGAAGVALTASGGPRTPGLLYVLGGCLLALRPPSSILAGP
jgi:peptidoglycan/LPS O-acetylase OafA/YrhL